jgi:hypothetical protein
MIVTPATREEHLRSKSRFYVAGWVASEGNELPQKEPYKEYVDEYKEYLDGFGEEKANSYRLSLPPFNVPVNRTSIV